METNKVFTEEASRLLEKESDILANELREEAINEAIRSRGEPIEVTASDVRKARALFTKRSFPLKPTTDLILWLYFGMGITMFLVGVSYPFLRKLLYEADLISRLSLMIALAGLGLALCSFFIRYYLAAVLRRKSRHRLEQLKKNTNDA